MALACPLSQGGPHLIQFQPVLVLGNLRASLDRRGLGSSHGCRCGAGQDGNDVLENAAVELLALQIVEAARGRELKPAPAQMQWGTGRPIAVRSSADADWIFRRTWPAGLGHCAAGHVG